MLMHGEVGQHDNAAIFDDRNHDYVRSRSLVNGNRRGNLFAVNWSVLDIVKLSLLVTPLNSLSTIIDGLRI